MYQQQHWPNIAYNIMSYSNTSSDCNDNSSSSSSTPSSSSSISASCLSFKENYQRKEIIQQPQQQQQIQYRNNLQLFGREQILPIRKCLSRLNSQPATQISFKQQHLLEQQHAAIGNRRNLNKNDLLFDLLNNNNSNCCNCCHSSNGICQQTFTSNAGGS